MKNPQSRQSKRRTKRTRRPNKYCGTCKRSPFYPLTLKQWCEMLEDLYDGQVYEPIILRQLASSMGFVNAKNVAACNAFELNLYKILFSGLPYLSTEESDEILKNPSKQIEVTGEQWRRLFRFWVDRMELGLSEQNLKLLNNIGVDPKFVSDRFMRNISKRSNQRIGRKP